MGRILEVDASHAKKLVIKDNAELVDAPKKEDPINKLNILQLKNILKEMKIEVKDGAKKEELIKLINDNK